MLTGDPTRAEYGLADVYFLAPEATLIYNSAFPYGFNDGAIWAGRGVTGAVQAGVGGHVGQFPVLNFQYRIITAQRDLIARLAIQNRSFEAGGVNLEVLERSLWG